ncbi:MAG: galactokinase [Acidobacteriia bacterium]|nr:galactokinase [Terriglobia bacterium]
MRAGSLIEIFQERFGGQARLLHAPGRVNLIGEHTDYNDGFVMPAAIQLSTLAAVAARPDRRIRVASMNVDGEFAFDLDDRTASPRRVWSDYVQGVALALEQAGYHLRGADVLFQSDVPSGGGLGSSAALEVSAALALLSVAGIQLPLLEIARICQKAENEFVDTRCGIMDQFAACFGRQDHAILLDCRSLVYRHLPLPSSIRMVVCNTMVKHELAAGAYNLRRADCEMGAKILGVPALRDVTPAQLQRRAVELPEQVWRRCRHVVHENARVESAADVLGAGDLGEFGRLMAESHRSLRDDYQVSCRELDLMVELAVGQPGVYGARMTGGGFGGCTVNLVAAPEADNFVLRMSQDYRAATGVEPAIHVCRAMPGGGQWNVPDPDAVILRR